MNTEKLNWKDIEISKSRDRENFDNLVEGKLPQYRDADLDSLKGKNPYSKGNYNFNKYQESTEVKDHHLDTKEYLENLDLLKQWDCFDEDDLLYESSLSNYEKMKLWQRGERNFNYKAASDEKLLDDYEICKRLKFSKGIMLIWAELKERGLIE